MTAVVSLDGGPSPRKRSEPKRDLVAHDLALENSDYTSDEDGGGGEGGNAASAKHRRTTSAAGVGGGAPAADCEGPNWRASVQQFDNFLCRVHAQVRGSSKGPAGGSLWVVRVPQTARGNARALLLFGTFFFFFFCLLPFFFFFSSFERLRGMFFSFRVDPETAPRLGLETPPFALFSPRSGRV